MLEATKRANIEMHKRLITTLRNKVNRVLKTQGFKINPHVRPAGTSKRTYKRIQKLAKDEQISKYKNFLLQHFETTKSLCRNGNEIVPEDIKLELREIKPDSFESIIARWWCRVVYFKS